MEKMKYLLILPMVSALSGCGSMADPLKSDPFACGIALVYEQGLARKNGLARHERNVREIARWFAIRVRTEVPKEKRSLAEANRLMKLYRENSALQKDMVGLCVDAAFADRAFRAWYGPYAK